jgi:FkbM family methyltransferase
MNKNIKKLLRTFQTNFPHLQNTKFTLMRLYRNKLKIPFEKDFYALHLFPDMEGALFLDAGANRGQSTDSILMRTKNSRIHLFEPNPLLWEKLERQYANNKRVIINKFGLGDKMVEQVMYIPFYKQWMFDGLSSFYEDKARNWLKGNVFLFKEKYIRLRKFKCQITKLDELDLAPFFIKLDIQGYEFQAIRGAEKTIKAYEPILLIESPNEKIIDYLKGFGYQFYSFKKWEFTPGTKGELNTFFMTENKSSMVKKYIKSG